MIPENLPENLKALFEAAKKAQSHSYSPYSKVRVGAAIRTRDGKLFSGCNVENSSYGATLCAERVAIFKAVSEGSPEVTEVMVITDATPPWPPCGMCRQVIAEFGRQATIHIANPQGEHQSMSFDKLFPHAFTPGHLLK